MAPSDQPSHDTAVTSALTDIKVEAADMQHKQRKIIVQWMLAIFGLLMMMVVNHIASENEKVLDLVQFALLLAMGLAIFIEHRNKNVNPTNQKSNDSVQLDFQDLSQKPVVVIYYGLIASIFILIASKAAREGVNPFESLGINFLFIGLLILLAPPIILMERNRYIAAGEIEQT